MVRTESTMLPLGTAAPDFALPDARTGDTVRLSDLAGADALLMMFICNHCPFVVHVQAELTRLCAEYGDKGVAIVGINANNLDTHPQDGPAHMKILAAELGWSFPYLFDGTQEVAKAYGAACTPDFFVFDGDQRLFYRGRMDASRPGNAEPNDGEDLRAALDAAIGGGDPPDEQWPSMGCNIKWKPGQEPKYFG